LVAGCGYRLRGFWRPGGSLFEGGRDLVPPITGTPPVIAVFEQRLHIDRVEIFVLYRRKIVLDIGEVEIDAISLRGRINAEQVIVAAGPDHRRNSASGDRQETPIDLLHVRVEMGIANDVGVTLSGKFTLAQIQTLANAGRVEEGLRDRTAVDIHLLIVPP